MPENNLVKTFIIVEKFSPEIHGESITKALISLRHSGDPYPPQQDASDDAESLFAWLMNETGVHQFVALINDEVAGHISLANPHLYLTNHLTEFHASSSTVNGFLEISKFFVSPDFQNRGVGSALFKKAVETATNSGYSPALAVIDTSLDAIHFYKKHRLVELG